MKVLPGQRVGKGETVAVLDSRNLRQQMEQSDASLQAARRAVAQSQQALNAARENFNNQQRRLQTQAPSAHEALAAQEQMRMAQTQLDETQLQLKTAQVGSINLHARSGLTQLHTPVDGVITNRYLNAGDCVDADTPIVEVADLNVVDVNASLPTDTGKLISVGEHATVNPCTDSDIKCDAQVKFVSPASDTTGNTVKVRLQARNQALVLHNGQAVTVVISENVKRTVILVPRKAVVPNPDDPDASMVYVVSAGRAKRESVTVGPINGDKIEIVSGLHGGEMIVSSGAYGLADNVPVEQRAAD